MPAIPRSLVALTCLLSIGCAHPKEAVEVRTQAAPTGLIRQLEIDTQRMAHGAGAAEWSVPGFVERHLATVGLVRARKTVGDTVVLSAELPTPGYQLIARVSPRPEQFCRVDLELEQVAEGQSPKLAETAPWWAIHSLEEVTQGVNSLAPPRLPALDEARFAHLSSEAAQLAQKGGDPLLSMDDYVRMPRPLDAGTADYFAPAETTDSDRLKEDQE